MCDNKKLKMKSNKAIKNIIEKYLMTQKMFIKYANKLCNCRKI